MTRTVGVRELKANASALLREVEATGEKIVVTVRGRPVARIEPMVDGRRRASAFTGRGIARGILPRADWEDFVEIRRWEPKSYDAD